jgi:hypothetical protein
MDEEQVGNCGGNERFERRRSHTLHGSHDSQRGKGLQWSVGIQGKCGFQKHTLAKKPQTLVASRMTAEMTKNGRLPQMFAPAAVKKVVNPIRPSLLSESIYPREV